MTQPPQPPGPGGWGPQQPGQNPQGQPQQPGGWQGQPGGQYPQSGPQAGGQYPGAGPAQNPGGHQPPHPPQGGYPPGFDGQPKKKSPLPWILGGVGAVVVLAGVAIAVLLFTGGPGEPRDVAQQYTDAMNQKDFATVGQMHCQDDQSQVEQLANPAKSFEDEGMPAEQAQELADSLQFKLTLDDVREDGGETATAIFSGDMAMSFAGQEQTFPVNQERSMIVEDGEWRFCGGADMQMAP